MAGRRIRRQAVHPLALHQRRMLYAEGAQQTVEGDKQRLINRQVATAVMALMLVAFHATDGSGALTTQGLYFNFVDGDELSSLKTCRCRYGADW